MPKTTKEWAEELKPLSVTLRRDITGDIEWTATQFREFMNHAQELCDAVDRLVLEAVTGKFRVYDRVRIKSRNVDGRVTAPWFRGGVWVDEEGPYSPDDLEKLP